jgi:hypothetical protein
MKNILTFLLPLLFIVACNSKEKNGSMIITESIKNQAVDSLVNHYGEINRYRIEKGVKQAAFFWQKEDGNAIDFVQFCIENFVADNSQLETLFLKISRNMEILNGNFNKMSLQLREPLDLDQGPIAPADLIFGAYNPASHLSDDFFKNKLNFHILLNFPSYTLPEKLEKGTNWNRQQWAYAAVGNIVQSREPADLLQKLSDASTAAEAYISEYNIYMGSLVNNEMQQLFPEDKKLISHWGLRDELKANYNTPGGFEKQKMIFELMNRIINQEIPAKVINNNQYKWNPLTNKIYEGSREIIAERETDIRYQHIVNYFKLFRQQDLYYPQYPTVISRAFEMNTQIPREKVEELFKTILSSKEVRETARLIEKRLGRKLEPFDIWYNGFRSDGSLDEEKLDHLTLSKYPNIDAFKNDLPAILIKLGFDKEKASSITSKISVDPARGSGHAAGALMRGDVAHLRTRFTDKGMNYKGYNIAIHEFGHNVEQTISLYNIDYYMLNGVPNTAFTEALAFLFQERDLELLGVNNQSQETEALSVLNILWNSYEIMGVALVDNAMWEWLYNHPDAEASDVKEAVTSIAKEIWNKYYADVFGVKDQVILAIYSHMVSYPLYLHSYPLGHIIQFQLKDFLKNRDFGKEIERIFSIGSITPEAWMMNAVGKPLSVDPLLKASSEALKKF